ncbi:energy-coupling factor ABC transporter ATP-binding protein [Liquorilactobacillus mali]|uniref:Cobalt transporter ATP-binding subunit n=1 Tax=Liquorilactobacillus mali KCTC 3596 = DSM 20444 TaxID=1046596 RepID=J0URZ0_9LACO|nr:energy-coupling factor ABC transporter ATP-binding protein [Liquorilactobacillus mali]EJE99607.1 cobalt transporter ATP-binding subunit [Liquorilactobacillus mali KCTC 3596 = DSM 20444]KRN09635.1 cobalt transporter ATP-binding subunit [Liquorilactobacillus mali KCTC 3596 = DSM 20444]MDC7952959.1 energy-coupling factor ABC transporter ATP-binding protein [Liquorilactobacillus mali]MDV7758411.1 energy-coupling factor ABC transporter ATP-binding protein [Liquorilactobacillus mali]QFQ73963.1 en
MDIVEIKNLTFKYPQQEVQNFNNFNLKIKKGEWLAIIGHNGSGKSTLVRLIDGLLAPESGEITVSGIKLTPESVWDVRSKIGMVFQNPDNQFVGANVEDDVAFGLENAAIPREEMLIRVRQALERVGMWEFADHEPVRLSGGQKQRVALAGIIALKPEIIILDEATSMLDPEGRQSVLEIIRELNQVEHLTVISITHDIDEASNAQRVVVLDDGKIVQDDIPAKIFSHGASLVKIGLEPPFSEKLKEELIKQEIKVPDEYLTKEGMVDWLWQLFSKQ